ncbi:uncharacterized protein [Halyomorpha halys]|uniref:uncharacterized protein n=1 Tax=Halyomorpha halys TaxID=286706 RepID=UPI0006D4E107|nr:uncharacterized protein LOC106678677 [Halyomorpha halys]
MDSQTDSPFSTVILKTCLNFNENKPKATSANDIKNWPIYKNKKTKTLGIIFENKIVARDVHYILKKRKQFKQKKFEKIFKGAVKILKRYPNYWLAHLFAGASAFKCKKYDDFATFYLSSAVLINPNCLSAWDGLQKYFRNNGNISGDVFDTIFSGYLINERKVDKWKDAVRYVLNNEISFTSRNPLKIISSLLKQDVNYDNDQKSFIANIISDYLFNQTKHMKPTIEYNSIIPDIAVASFSLYCDNNTGQDLKLFYSDALSFLYYNNAVRHIHRFILGTLNTVRSLTFNNVEFITDIIEFLFANNLDPCCYLSRALIDEVAKTNILFKPNPTAGFLLSLLSFSLGDYTRSRDYRQKYTKDKHLVWKLNVLQISSSIHLQDFEFSWTKLLSSVSEHVSSLNKINGVVYESQSCAQLHLDLFLYLLTHNSNSLMQKFGLMLCLKLIHLKCENVRILFYASIASIHLKENKILTVCLRKLARLGALNDIIFLSALKTESYSDKIMYLKEIQHLRHAHLYTAVLSYRFQKESKALKNFYKASVMVPDNSVLYEWLGIHAYENHNIMKAKLYFEIALFYNPHSWTSINYYASILAIEDPASSKMFLSLYSINRKQLTFQLIVDLKAGLTFFKNNPSKGDYFKACEYFRHCLKIHPNNRYFKEMLAESYSKFGMIGSGLKCFKESYITNNYRHLYSGSMIGKQYLFVKGVTKYLKIMKCVASCGGMDVFIVLHNSAHAFLIKSIQLSSKCYYFLAQIYCQQALLFCVRAISISANYSSIWKLMGDILFQCSCLGYSAGFIYIPHWLLRENASKKIVLVRRYQSVLLAIRCYYAGLNIRNCSKKMMVCLWNSISVALRKLSSLSSKDNKQKLLTLGIQSSVNSLQIDLQNSLSWNLLGVLINDKVFAAPSIKNRKVTQNSSAMALNTSLNLGSPVAYSLFSTCNAGFIAISRSDFEKAYKLFLSARGTYSSLDKPWLGDMLINLLTGNVTAIIQNIVYLYLLTYHRPTLNNLFTSLLFLSPFLPDRIISCMGRKYYHKLGCGNVNFMNYFLSGTISYERKKYKNALIDYIIALRTCPPISCKHLTFVNSTVQDLFATLVKNQ